MTRAAWTGPRDSGPATTGRPSLLRRFAAAVIVDALGVAALVAGPGATAALATDQTFTSSGTYTVPAGVTVLRIVAKGAGGGGGSQSAGGTGATVTTFQPVSPADVLTVTVGTGGLSNSNGNTGGSGEGAGGNGVYNGGGGGGSTSVLAGTTVQIAAGAGGGGGGGNSTQVGGTAGILDTLSQPDASCTTPTVLCYPGGSGRATVGSAGVGAGAAYSAGPPSTNAGTGTSTLQGKAWSSAGATGSNGNGGTGRSLNSGAGGGGGGAGAGGGGGGSGTTSSSGAASGGAGGSRVSTNALGTSTFSGTGGAAGAAGANGANGSVVITPVAQNPLTWTDPTLTTGDTGLLTATAGSGGAVTFSSLTPAICTLAAPTTATSTTVTAVAAGSCTVRGTTAGDSTYAPGLDEHTFTIEKPFPTLTVTAPSVLPYGQTATLSAASNSSGAVSFSTFDVNCVLANASLTAVSGIGTCTVTATIAADAQYAARSASAMVPLAKASQSALTLSSPPSTAVVGGSYQAVAAGGSGTGAVSYGVQGAGACSIDSAGLVAFTAVGSCVITASKAADQNYLAAQASPATVVVGPMAAPPARSSPPAVTALTSTGAGVTPQHVTVALRAGETLTLQRPDGSQSSSVTLDGIGVYALDATTGVITFTPVAGYHGTATPVTYRKTNDGGSNTSTYTPTVTLPAPPDPQNLTSTGRTSQQVGVSLAEGSTLTLLDNGTETSSVTLDGQGTYSSGPGGTLAFAPTDAFHGTAGAATYRVTDPYGQSGTANYTATVTNRATAPLPRIARSEWAAVPSDPKQTRGKERRTKAYDSTRNGTDAYPLGRLGDRQLTQGQATTLTGAPMFRHGTARLTATGKALVRLAVAKFELASAIRCEGYTDYAGSTKPKYGLSTRRAVAVCAALQTSGADVVTSSTAGYGPSRPAVIGGPAAGRSENRRVVVLVTR